MTGKALIDPKLQEAIRYYTDPLLPTFGNKLASCVQAGFASGQPLDNDNARAEVARIQDERREAGKKVSEFLGTYTFDAARELIDQLGEGSRLETIDPTDLLRAPTEDEIMRGIELAAGAKDASVQASVILKVLHDDRMERAEQISKHNRMALAAAKQRLSAVELLLSYQLGRPGEGGPKKTGSGAPDEIDLGKLSRENLQLLGEAVHDLLEQKKGAPKTSESAPVPAVDGQFEVEP